MVLYTYHLSRLYALHVMCLIRLVPFENMSKVEPLEGGGDIRFFFSTIDHEYVAKKMKDQ